MLPERYQQWITGEINRILREIEKEEESDMEKFKNGDNQQAVWRRENDIRSELEKSKLELAKIMETVVEYENKCEYLRGIAVLAEEKESQALLELERTAAKIYNEDMMMVLSDEETSLEDPQHVVLHLNKVVSKGKFIIYLKYKSRYLNLSVEYFDDTSIDVFVKDTAKATNRSLSKAAEWTQKLKDQDIMTLGDLRELFDEDWSSIGLTVFAIRALKNMLRNIDNHS